MGTTDKNSRPQGGVGLNTNEKKKKKEKKKKRKRRKKRKKKNSKKMKKVVPRSSDWLVFKNIHVARIA
ncbi:unnamed protein product [Nippostrongylus brasiliensis]|uniref:Uncharacterized protein n=1 Tax=Nippostrongylus brasiliensis TaxID=27835 RepID=A0A0N4XT33_NIPBR|nr:unnamed protein product [Nippostrongylus brasiliensis]